MSKTREDIDLMKKVEEFIKDIKEIFDAEVPESDNKKAPTNISSGDKVFDNAVKNALRKGKPKS